MGPARPEGGVVPPPRRALQNRVRLGAVRRRRPRRRARRRLLEDADVRILDHQTAAAPFRPPRRVLRQAHLPRAQALRVAPEQGAQNQCSLSPNGLEPLLRVVVAREVQRARHGRVLRAAVLLEVRVQRGARLPPQRPPRERIREDVRGDQVRREHARVEEHLVAVLVDLKGLDAQPVERLQRNGVRLRRRELAPPLAFARRRSGGPRRGLAPPPRHLGFRFLGVAALCERRQRGVGHVRGSDPAQRRDRRGRRRLAPLRPAFIFLRSFCGHEKICPRSRHRVHRLASAKAKGAKKLLRWQRARAIGYLQADPQRLSGVDNQHSRLAPSTASLAP